MKTEAEALATLCLTQKGLIKNGFFETLQKVVEFWYQDHEERDWCINHTMVTERNEIRPPFIPDATRFKWGYLGEGEERIKMPCIELWEIEKTNPLTQAKIDKIEGYLVDIWDDLDYPDFEVWTANSRGRGVDRVFSMFEDICGVKVDYNHD